MVWKETKEGGELQRAIKMALAVLQKEKHKTRNLIKWGLVKEKRCGKKGA